MRKFYLFLSLMITGLLSTAYAGESVPFYDPCYNGGVSADIVQDVPGQTSSTYMWQCSYTVQKTDQYYKLQRRNTSSDHNGTVFTKEIDFKAGKCYRVKVRVNSYSLDGGAFKVNLATGTTQSTFDGAPLMQYADLERSYWQEFECYFVPTQNMTRRIAFTDITPKTVQWFYLQGIWVDEVSGIAASAPTNLTVTADPNQEMKVTLKVTAPSTTVDGKALAKIDGLKVYVHKSHLYTIKDVQPGQTVNVTFPVTMAGEYRFTVSADANGVESQCARYSTAVLVGPTLADWYASGNYASDYNGNGWRVVYTATYRPGQGMSLKYDSVTAAQKGATSFTVKRMPDNKTIVENGSSANIIDSSFLTDAKDNTYYWYDLYVNGATTPVSSNNVAINCPIMYNFFVDAWSHNQGTYKHYKNVTPYDPLKERCYWSAIGGALSYIGSADSKGGFMINPGVKLEAGKTYRVDYNISTDFERIAGFEVLCGKSNTPEALTTSIIPYTEVAYNKIFYLHTGYFTPTETDNYFIGIRAWVDNIDQTGDIYVDRIHIEECPADLPRAVENLSIAFKSALEGVLSFNTASNNVAGKPQQELDRVEIYKNGSLFKTISNATPGTAYTVDVPITPKQTDEYTVVACNSLGKSLEKKTSIFLDGAPFYYDFANAPDVKNWTVIDGYRDGYSWGQQSGEYRAYDSDGKLAEWAFTPPIYMEAGKYYQVRFAGRTGRETILLSSYIGDKPEIQAMSQTIKEHESIEPLNYNRYITKYISVPETKAYYIGFHAEDTIERKSYSSYHAFIDDFQMKAAQPGTIPGMGHMTITPASNGSASAVVTLQVPTTDLEGNSLAKPCTKAHVYYKSISSYITSHVKDWVAADLKQTIDLSSTDDVEIDITSGLSANYYHIFKVEFENEDGIGVPEEQIAYIGVNYPALPDYIKATPDESDPTFNKWTLTWTKPVLDESGFPLNCARVIYDLKYQTWNCYPVGQGTYLGSASNITSNYADTVYNYNPYPVTTQQFRRFNVLPKACPNLNNTSSMKYGSTYMVTEFKPFGPAYKLPFAESWPYGRGTMIFRGGLGAGFGAYAFTSKALNATPYDNDGGMLTFQFEFLEDACGMLSGRIDLDIAKPVLRFALYNFGDNERTDINTVQVLVRRLNKDWELVAEKTVDEWTLGQKENWSICSVDLSAYSGQLIEFAFVGICNRLKFVAIDHVTIGEPNDIDVTAASFTLPEEGYVGRPISPFSFTVKNNGVLKAEGVTAALYRNGVKVSDEVSLGDIEPEELASCEFTDSLTLADLDEFDEFKYYVVVTAEGDADTSDNTSAVLTLPMIQPATYPSVGSLAGTGETEKVRLSWTKPAIPTEPEAIVDDFESYPSWTGVDDGNMGFWSFYDTDEMPICNLEYVFGTEWPIQSYSRQSFVLANFTDYCFEVFHENFPDMLDAHSGEKTLVSIQNNESYDWPVCDWLISPKLPGTAQTISLYAKGAAASEYIDVLYTDRDTRAVRNFKVVDYVAGIPANTWTKYDIELPDSTVRFAIRHYRSGGYAVLVDDIEFTPLGNERLVLEGYNVYRNGELIARNYRPADINAESVEYVDNIPAEGSYDYEVSAVYNRGESLPELTTIDLTGLTSLSAKSAAVYGLAGKIAVKGAEGMGVEVYTVDGVLVNMAEGRDDMTIAVPAGFYIVSVGNESFKITVR